MHRTLREAIVDLESAGQLRRIDVEIDPCLEAAYIQRRVVAAGGPAILFSRVKGTPFPMLGNLFGTIERVRYLFRDTLDAVHRLVALKVDPAQALKHPFNSLRAVPAALHMLPRRVKGGPVLMQQTTIDQLPALKSWPDDGGPFITLPQVYTEDPDAPGWQRSNLGMYRVQLSGNQYRTNREIGLHYQLHRGIGVHHSTAIRRGEPLRVHIFVGGPPAMTVAAVMPLPEGLSELSFAGALGGRRLPIVKPKGRPAIHAEADFCIVGTIDPARQLPEGPFGDHLGYYARQHDFPVLNVETVFHRPGAIWPFTTVGRPPQEDTAFGQFIHELTGSVIPSVLPGVKAVHAVDAAGVHPLLLAVGSERYTPYQERTKPQELLTQANAILGQGQMSLAKYVWIAAQDDAPQLDPHHIAEFFQHMLRRVDWRRDLHFHTSTTIDTLDYSGSGFNTGSKVVIAAVGPAVRELPSEVPGGMRLPEGWSHARVALPGVLVVRGPRFAGDETRSDVQLERSVAAIGLDDSVNRFPLVVVVDDAEFTAQSLNNWLWVTFTRSNPAADIYGVGAESRQKHWGCRGSLVIDARSKPHHAPPLIDDPAVVKKVEGMAAKGGPLAGLI